MWPMVGKVVPASDIGAGSQGGGEQGDDEAATLDVDPSSPNTMSRSAHKMEGNQRTTHMRQARPEAFASAPATRVRLPKEASVQVGRWRLAYTVGTSGQTQVAGGGSTSSMP